MPIKLSSQTPELVVSLSRQDPPVMGLNPEFGPSAPFALTVSSYTSITHLNQQSI